MPVIDTVVPKYIKKILYLRKVRMVPSTQIITVTQTRKFHPLSSLRLLPKPKRKGKN